LPDRHGALRIFRAREAISAKVKPLLENQSGKRW
jgi:RNA polymerase sigma-70 factor (ECF subfamily)